MFSVSVTTLVKIIWVQVLVQITCFDTKLTNTCSSYPSSFGDYLYWGNIPFHTEGLFHWFTLWLYLKFSPWGSQSLKGKSWAQKWARLIHPHGETEEHTRSTQTWGASDEGMRDGFVTSCPVQAKYLMGVFHTATSLKRKGNVEQMHLVGNCRGGDRAEKWYKIRQASITQTPL